MDESACQDEIARLVEQMFAHGRYALLLRPQIAGSLAADHLVKARCALERAMALVPKGNVVLEAWQSEALEQDLDSATARRQVFLEPFYLDRYTVTNRQFQQFVDEGGYWQKSLWHPAVWPQISELVDRSCKPGPHYWSEGKMPPGQEDRPVVGVSWFEADAFARWTGKRLPSDAEWVKAACAPITADGGMPLQRRFPWGDTFDVSRANLWSTGRVETAPVDAFSEGAGAGGIYQLIGNVWEWTAGPFEVPARSGLAKGGFLELQPAMNSLRGGAFDTYLEDHATCQAQSGDVPWARRHNIGFRCAISLCDLLEENPQKRNLSPS